MFSTDREVQILERRFDWNNAGDRDLSFGQFRYEGRHDVKISNIEHCRIARSRERTHARLRLQEVQCLRNRRRYGYLLVRPIGLREICWPAGLKARAGLHDNNLIGQALGFEQEVRAHQHGLSVVGHLPNKIENSEGRLWVEPRSWFVEQEEVRFMQNSSSECKPRLHARRVAAHELVECTLDRKKRCCFLHSRVGLLPFREVVQLCGIEQIVASG